MGTVTILPELASQARTWTMPGPDGWTVDDLPELGEGLRYELVDGCLVVSPMQPPAHNGAAFELGYRLRQVLTREWAVTVPGGIQFDQRNWREPDLMVLRRAALDCCS